MIPMRHALASNIVCHEYVDLSLDQLYRLIVYLNPRHVFNSNQSADSENIKQ